MPSSTPESPSQIAARAVEQALRSGADAADAVVFSGSSHSISIREGEREEINSAESCEIGLRAFAGNSQAIVSTSKFNDSELASLAEQVVAMARVAPADEYNGLAGPGELAEAIPDLDLADSKMLTTDDLLALALEAEEAGRAVKGISASAGAGANASRRTIALAASNGFSGEYERTGYSISAGLIAGTGTNMVRDYEYDSALHFKDLAPPSDIGKKAGERTARRANPRKVPSQSAPVVFEQRLASSLLGHLSGAINGAAVVRGTSFLKDKLGERIFRDDVQIIDNGRLKKGHGSRPFDAEGLATQERAVVKNGKLRSWFLDLHSARQLGLNPTGNAARGTSSSPSASPNNFDMQPGAATPEELIFGIKNGFLVTELIGMGVNGVTGDYSRGASGFWIEGGKICFPVSEITIAGNLMDMYLALTPATDLVIRGAMNAPTCLIEEMTIAGT